MTDTFKRCINLNYLLFLHTCPNGIAQFILEMNSY